MDPPLLFADLTAARDRMSGSAVTVEEVAMAFKDRASAMLLLLALPFCIIPFPGLSTPFGIGVLLIGLAIAFGQKPRLPRFILRIKLSHSLALKILNGAIKFVGFTKTWVRPRMSFLQRWPGMMNLIGLSIVCDGLLLTLPLPIPFTNVIPAWAVVMLASGMMERDGVMVILGHIMTLLAIAFVGLTSMLGARGFDWLFRSQSLN